ncbi:unnamed protein product [Alternaria alternata]
MTKLPALVESTRTVRVAPHRSSQQAKLKTGRDCSGEYKALTSQARALSNLLEDIQDKYDKIPENKQQQLINAYEPCIEVLEELDKLVLRYNGLDTKSKRAWDRLKYDPEITRNLRERLIASVSMLNSFYTTLIHDSQVLILEALERLEKDYKGGYREESIASIGRLTSAGILDNDKDDEESWSQILRDLEDVGVSQQQAVSYRDLIVDWLLKAVNEGRLLEERPGNDYFETMQQDLGTALPEFEFEQRLHSFDVPTMITPSDRGSPAASIEHTPVSSPLITQKESVYLAPSATPLAYSSTSLQTPSRRSGSEASSLYAEPRPSSLPATPADTVMKRIPVPPLSAPIPVVPAYNPPIIAAVHPTSPPPPLPSVTNITEPFVAPPSYYEKDTTITIDLEWTAHQIVAAWAQNDFITAERLLEDQLTAVERGHTCVSGVQPDRRILRHLLGVCASYTGKFTKAKRLFESVFNGIYLNRQNLDDGDIAAARWLGDVCLHTQEHTNAALAYSVAYEGSLGRFGVAPDRTQRVAAEIRLVDHWLWVFKRIEDSLKLNMDPTNIFASTNVVEKSNLMMSVKNNIYETAGSDAVQLDRYMNTVRLASYIGRPLSERELPTNTLGDSKKLHFLTKRGNRWLIEAVKQGLREIGIEHAEHGYEPSIVCCLNQQRQGVVFSEGVEICFSKLPFRHVYGIKVSDVKWATRRFNAVTQDLAQSFRDTTDFRNIIKGIMERAEAKAAPPGSTQDVQHESMDVYAQVPHVSPLLKRPSYG